MGFLVLYFAWSTYYLCATVFLITVSHVKNSIDRCIFFICLAFALVLNHFCLDGNSYFVFRAVPIFKIDLFSTPIMSCKAASRRRYVGMLRWHKGRRNTGKYVGKTGGVWLGQNWQSHWNWKLEIGNTKEV